ncbi:hypothetical protein G5B10_07885 [Fluviicola sp. SGL-29]|nr:hypothetical protein [Fluviicola sp. SGL-29]
MKTLLFITLLLISYNSFSQVAKFKANWFGTKETVKKNLQPDKVSIFITINIEENKLTIYTIDIQRYELMPVGTEEEEGKDRQYFQAVDKSGNLCQILMEYDENFTKGKFAFFIQYKDKINDTYWWYWADIIDYEE